MDLRKIICSTLVCVLLAVVVACGDDDGGGTPTPGSDVSGTPRPTAPTNFPEDFPLNFPIYPSAEFDSGIRIGYQVLAVFSTLDSRGDVADFYRDSLDEEPWELISESEGDNGKILLVVFRHTEEDIRGSMTLSSVPSGTAININFTVPESVGPTLPPFNSETADALETPSETE